VEQKTLRQIQVEVRCWATHNFPNRKTHHPLLGAVEEIGELAHAHLKTEQGIRKIQKNDGPDAVGDVIIYLLDYCNLMGWDAEQILNETWNHVKQRDWKSNPETGLST
jgi:NTP pyrophosphatase (non-canonical NTP hydrolase)